MKVSRLELQLNNTWVDNTTQGKKEPYTGKFPERKYQCDISEICCKCGQILPKNRQCDFCGTDNTTNTDRHYVYNTTSPDVKIGNI